MENIDVGGGHYGGWVENLLDFCDFFYNFNKL